MLSNTYTDRRTDTYGCITRPKGADGITKTCLSTYSNLEVGDWRITAIWQQCYIEAQSNFFSNFDPRHLLVTNLTTDEEEALQDIYPYYVLRTRNKDSSIQLRRTDFLISLTNAAKH